eukprot:CCRYP_006568-RB/>CCRYP_006568-RB protein AED:0.47 eAED:1.00 QI:0/0/0/1/0/0/3/0/167
MSFVGCNIPRISIQCSTETSPSRSMVSFLRLQDTPSLPKSCTSTSATLTTARLSAGPDSLLKNIACSLGSIVSCFEDSPGLPNWSMTFVHFGSSAKPHTPDKHQHPANLPSTPSQTTPKPFSNPRLLSAYDSPLWHTPEGRANSSDQTSTPSQNTPLPGRSCHIRIP